MKTYEPKSIKEAIDDFQTFLECDLYTSFRPEIKLPTGKKGKKQSWYREDPFEDEKAFLKYIEGHFKILTKQIIKLIGKKEFVKDHEKGTGGEAE